jgi:hypothetical protein
LQIHSNNPERVNSLPTPARGLSKGVGISRLSYKSSLLLNNKNSGTTYGDGLLIENHNLNAEIKLQEKGILKLVTQNNKGISINNEGEIQINTLSGADERILTADNNGNVSASIELESIQDDMGNCSATRDVEMNGKYIYNSNNDVLFIGNRGTSGISMFGNNYNQNFKKGSITFQTSAATGAFRFTNTQNWESLLFIGSDGRVGIGTDSPEWGYKLEVKGKAHFCEVVVKNSGWCDYVFEDTYKLMPLNELETFVNQNHHLPEIPTAQDVKENDVNLGEMNKLLLKKIEELTLYVIDLQQQVNAQQQQIINIETK